MKLKKYLYPISLAALVFAIFYKALFNFYTHDDWFHFRISEANSLNEFFNFFNLTQGPSDWGYYRPLSTQVIYFVNRTIFDKSPLAMHMFAFVLFFTLLFIVYKLIYLFTANKRTTQIATAIYALSSSHFSHLYSIANQELIHGIGYLSSIYFFYQFITNQPNIKKLGLSLVFFIMALLSKEMAITLPAILVILSLYAKLTNQSRLTYKKLFMTLLPYISIWGVYLYLHIFYYGLVEGDSYIWNISPKVALNSVMWYGLWSLNIPTMLVDFVGPGININPNLFKFWSAQITPIFIIFAILLTTITYTFITSIKQTKRKDWLQYLTFALWFIIPLTPVVFLQWHKYPTYLTIPSIAVSVILANILVKSSKKFPLIIFFISFIILSKLTHDLNYQTNWLTTGAQTCRRVYEYVNKNFGDPVTPTTIVFFDQPQDQELPWSPSEQLKVALSNNNFFQVYYPSKISAEYTASEPQSTNLNVIKVPARQFMGY